MLSPESSTRHRHLPLIAALTMVLATAGILSWLHHRMSEQRTVRVGAFDINDAMTLAGTQVPADIESFYFFTLDRAVSDESIELSDTLVQAAEEHDFIGIAGADPEHNLTVVLTALAAPRDRTLAGLIIIYVGPPEQEAALTEAVRPTGAELRFVPYAPAPPPSAREETI